MGRRPGRGCLVHHSDRGVQYACADYAALLSAHDITPSMSRVGNPYDNTRAESFMKTLKQEEVDGSAYRDMAAVSTGIAAFIKDVYNRNRLHSALGYLTLTEFEAGILPQAAAVRRPLAASETNCPPEPVSHNRGALHTAPPNFL